MKNNESLMRDTSEIIDIDNLDSDSEYPQSCVTFRIE